MPSTTTPPRPGDSYVQSFARGLEVIRSFSAQAPRQTLSEVAARSGLTRAGARRILLTLQTLGYVETDGRDFRLTARILDLGFAYLSSMPIWNLAEPVVEALVESVKESSSAAVLDGTDIVYVMRVPTHKIMKNSPGHRLAPAGLLHLAGPHAAGRAERRRSAARGSMRPTSSRSPATRSPTRPPCSRACSRRANRAGAW